MLLIDRSGLNGAADLRWCEGGSAIGSHNEHAGDRWDGEAHQSDGQPDREIREAAGVRTRGRAGLAGLGAAASLPSRSSRSMMASMSLVGRHVMSVRRSGRWSLCALAMPSARSVK